MSTQGLLSVVNEKGDVIFKAVAGSNGMDVPAAAKSLRQSKSILTLDYVYQTCQKKGMGSLVVMDVWGGVKDDGILDGEPLPPLYRSTFNDPEFNPRWDRGTAAYPEIVEVDGME